MKEYQYKIEGVIYKKGPGAYAMYQYKNTWRESAYVTNQKLLEYPAYKIKELDNERP